jgi:ribonuclease BN (tRNA processing enzyme)
LHDAEYTPTEYKIFKEWGHSLYTDVLDLAFKAGVKKLGLFHLNQERTDDQMDKIVDKSKQYMADNQLNIDCFGVAMDMSFTV